VTTDTDTDTTGTEPAADFVFEAQVRFPAGRLEAVVRYDGDGDTLKSAARQIGVTVEDAGPDDDGNRRIRITGSDGDVQRAVREYAQRARTQGAYELGNLGIAGWM
jgi:hypothetical protein